MSNESTGGVSKRSLVLLGAFAALALNKDLRRGLVLGTRDALDNAHNTLDDTVRPALNTAARQAQHAAAVAAEQAGQTWDHLREDGPQRAQSLLGSAQDVVGTLAATAAERAAQLRKDAEKAAAQAKKDYDKQYAPKLGDLHDDLMDAADEGRHKAEKALKQARRRGMATLADLGDKASTLRESALVTMDDHRRDAERALARARRDAEKELRRSGKKWNQKKLEKAIEKRMAPVHRQVQLEFARLEKEAGRKGSRLKAELRPEPQSGGMGGGLTGLLLLGAGAVVLARVPAARQGVLSAVEAVSPEAAKKLHSFSHQARNIVGDMWLETLDEKGPQPAAPAAAPSTRAATTGASAYATPEPGSSAAAKPSQPGEEKPATQPSDAPSGTDKPKNN